MADFFFKTTKLGLYLFMIPKNYRYTTTICMLAILTITWLFFIYYPLQQQNSSCLQMLNQLSTHQELAAKTLTNSATLERKICNKQKQYEHYVSVLQKNYASSNDAFMILFDLASKSNLMVQSHVPNHSNDASWYLLHTFQTDFQGTFNNIMTFLEAFSKSSPGLEIASITLEKITDTTLNLSCLFNFMQIKES